MSSSEQEPLPSCSGCKSDHEDGNKRPTEDDDEDTQPKRRKSKEEKQTSIEPKKIFYYVDIFFIERRDKVDPATRIRTELPIIRRRLSHSRRRPPTLRFPMKKMSLGRGRGYSGRHHLNQRDPRPGDQESDEMNAVRTLAELSPRATELTKVDLNIGEASKSTDEDKDEIAEKVDKNIVVNEDEVILNELLHIDEQYTPLLVLLEQFSPGEDGIQFNRKLRQFESTVTTMCPDETRLQNAFATFRAAALQSGGTARRLAAVGASFTRQQRQQLLRATLLNVVMQGTFTKLEVLERANPIYLINATNLMGDYFAEARLCNGNKMHILASPLLQYMRALLASDDLRAHRSLATQLMQNGRELLTVLTQELEDLSISIRLRLLTPPPVSVIWLLLSADLCLNKFLPLPNAIQTFYASHLELTTDEGFNEVTYGAWKKTKEEYRSENTDTEKTGQSMSQLNLSQEDDTKPKLRPILGAGAGLLRQEQLSQEFDTWTGKGSTNLAKRYDLNSWRQAEEKKEESEPVFNPTVLPPNIQNFPVDYPPPNYNYQENYANYLQQGDGAYIQSFQGNSNYTPTELVPFDRTPPEKVNNEIQKTANRRSVDSWRKEKSDLKEDSNKSKKNWTQHRSNDNVNSDDENDEKRSLSRNSREPKVNHGKVNRRNSGEEGESSKTPPRRHVSDVPRSQKYWDHDDRCDIEYS